MDKLGWFMLRHQHDAREDEPVGTADTSSFDYIRWQYVAETEKERPAQPSLYYVEYDTQRPTLAFV